MKIKLLLLILLISQFFIAQNFHDTQGKLVISGSGQSSYNLPIAMPPSLKDIGPVINLVYSSGQSGGIAGQGWNISSVSAISRIATRLDIDGFIDGVDFDDNDKLALDGQRLLLKSGVYWQNGSVYETDVQSNTKVELKVVGGTTYFEVTSPDGSKNFYGNFNTSNAEDKTAYYLARFEDINGNFMLYNYFKPYGKNICLSDIQFSANRFTNPQPINKIQFFYRKTTREEYAYIHGEKREKVEILNKIDVTTNTMLFKRYILSHVQDDFLGYERVMKIQEFNGNGEPANPVEFTYDQTETIRQGSENVKTFTNNFNFNDTRTAGDFDGDGRLDFATDNQLYTKIFEGSNGNTPLNMAIGGDEQTRIVATTLKNGKLNQKQSFVVADETVNAINFKYYSLNDNETTIVLDNIKSVAFDNSISNAISGGPAGVTCEIPDKKSSNKYLEGDFNGDGLSEILITSTIDEKYYVNDVEHDQPEQGYFSYCTVTTNADSQTN